MPWMKNMISGDFIILMQSKSSTAIIASIIIVCYHSVTLAAGMHLMIYYLSLLQVQQMHAE